MATTIRKGRNDSNDGHAVVVLTTTDTRSFDGSAYFVRGGKFAYLTAEGKSGGKVIFEGTALRKLAKAILKEMGE